MSLREDIVKNIVKVLKDADDPRFGLVTREPFDPAQLSRQQFPAIYVQSADEVRGDITMGTSSGLREATLELRLVGWVNGTTIDTQRNDLIERVEEALEADRTRGAIARWTQLREVTVDFDVVEPFGRVDLVVEVYYTYTRAQS